jgi:hypothetical protein
VTLAIAFFIAAAALTKHHSMSWNDNSRLATIDALSAHHTFAIETERVFPTGDKYLYDGHFYSDKPPALALGGAAAALVLAHTGLSLERQPGLGYYLLTLLFVGFAYAGGLAALYESLRILRAGTLWSACVVIAAGAATFLLPYATIFNNHVVSGALLIIGFRFLIEPRCATWSTALGAGAIALAATIDISFVIFVALAPLLLLRHGLRRTILPFVAATVPFAAVYLALNFALSGSFLPPALNPQLWAYAGSAFNSTNLTGLAVHRSVWDHLSYAVDLLAGNHGLLTYMPILIVSSYGLVRGWRRRPELRFELAFIGLGCILYVASYVWSSNDYSGFAYGVRWYAGIVYLATVPLAFIEDAVAQSALVRSFFIGATFISACVAVVGLVDPATPNNAGIPPFLYNLQELNASHHPVKDAAMALFALGTTALVARLATLVRGPQIRRRFFASGQAIFTDGAAQTVERG